MPHADAEALGCQDRDSAGGSDPGQALGLVDRVIALRITSRSKKDRAMGDLVGLVQN
jgi:hypothetical protein